jgi:hypothetical protein
VPVYLHWEHAVPPHRRFREVEVELLVCHSKRLTRRRRRIGSHRNRSLTLLVTSAEVAGPEVTALNRRRGGCALVKEV